MLSIEQLSTFINVSDKMLTVKELLNNMNYPMNELYIDKFWNNIENDKWIYIDNDMLKYIGYSENDIKFGKQNYIKILTDNFELNNDYKLMFSKEFNDISKCYLSHLENEKINTHNKTKHLIVSPDCFKQSLMMLRTNKSKEIKKYYVELEKIFKFYLQYQAKYQELKLNGELNDLKKDLNEEKQKNSYLNKNAFDYHQLMMKEYLYIATTFSYAYQNNFKIGKTNNLTQRLSQYNTSHNKNQKYYYVFLSEPTYYAKSIEYILKHILTKFRNSDTNEIYVINFEFLEKIVKNVCDNYNASINYYNELITDEMNNMDKKPIIPKDVFDVNNVEQEDKEIKETVFNDKKVVIEYYNDNKEYEFIRFENSDKKINYKCNRCDKIFNRTDHMQEHFKRKVKCYDSTKFDKINKIKENNENPEMIYYNKNFSYYEKYLETEDRNYINYYCNRCGQNTNKLSVLKKHFERKEKCFEMKSYDNDNVEIEKINNNDNYTYCVTLFDGVKQYNCMHCKYKTNVFGNMSRHFTVNKNKCWEKKKK